MSDTNLAFDLSRFMLTYKVNGTWAPIYQLFPPNLTPEQPTPPPMPAPFNTPETPFLIPADVEDFGGSLFIRSGFSVPVFWRVRFEMSYGIGVPQVITSKGLNSQGNPFEFLDLIPTPPVEANDAAGAGFTPLSVDGIFATTQYQPSDFGIDVPVRMKMTLTAHSGPPSSDNVLPDTDRTTNVLEVWLKLV